MPVRCRSKISSTRCSHTWTRRTSGRHGTRTAAKPGSRSSRPLPPTPLTPPDLARAIVAALLLEHFFACGPGRRPWQPTERRDLSSGKRRRRGSTARRIPGVPRSRSSVQHSSGRQSERRPLLRTISCFLHAILKDCMPCNQDVATTPFLHACHVCSIVSPTSRQSVPTTRFREHGHHAHGCCTYTHFRSGAQHVGGLLGDGAPIQPVRTRACAQTEV